MDMILKIIEKILVNTLFSVVMIFLSFSFFTGKFPPHKEDIRKAISLTKELFSSTKEYNQQVASLNGQAPNFEQLVTIQKLGLRRSEIALQFTKLMERIPQAQASPQVNERLEKITDHLSQVDQALGELNAELQKMGESK